MLVFQSWPWTHLKASSQVRLRLYIWTPERLKAQFKPSWSDLWPITEQVTSEQNIRMRRWSDFSLCVLSRSGQRGELLRMGGPHHVSTGWGLFTHIWQDVSMETNMIHCPSSFLLIWFSLGIIYPEILDAHRTQTDFIQPVKLFTCFQVQCVTLTSRCHCWFRQQLKVEADLFTFEFYRINQHKAVLDCEIMGFSYHEVVICVFLLFLTSFSIPQKKEIHSFLLNVLF